MRIGCSTHSEALPLGWHSSVWVSHNQLFYRLRTRKHRQSGSILCRPCRCSAWGKHMCALHRLQALDVQPGTKLCDITPYEAAKMFRSRLQAVGVPNFRKFGFRAFRAGRATAMAAAGEPLAAILQAGEWRSAALLRYISETELDRKALLAAAFCVEDED